MNRRILGVRAVTLAAMAVGFGIPALTASSADASILAPASCAATVTSQPFSPWGDTNNYTLMAGGGFAGSAPGWTLTGGAQVVSATVPWDLAGNGATGALYLPAGATAQSPYMCVDAADPTDRLVDLSASGNSTVAVQSVYRSLLGLPVPLTTSVVGAGSSWAPTPQLQTGAAPASLVSGGTAQMSLRFTAGPGGAYIDDVFVDPRMSR